MTNKKTTAAVTVNGIAFSESDILALKGEANSETSSTTDEATRPADTYTPSTSIQIGNFKSSIKPVIRNESGDAIKQTLVTRPNITKFNTDDAKRRLAEIEAAEKEELAKSKLTPDALNATIQVLDRKVKRLEKALRALEKGNAN